MSGGETYHRHRFRLAQSNAGADATPVAQIALMRHTKAGVDNHSIWPFRKTCVKLKRLQKSN
jgi:hypothetical protein